jgi:Protein of unknown function (DUF998)
MTRKPIITKDITARQLLFSKIAMVTGIAYVAILLLLHLLEPEYNPTWRFISEYALGKFGFLMNICFLMYSAALISLVVSVKSQVKSIIGYIGLAILAIGAIGIIMCALFNTDPITTDMAQISSNGQKHYTGASLDYTPIGFLLLAFSFRKKEAWRPIFSRLLITSVISILLTVAMVASMPSDYKFGPETYTGLIGRFMFASTLASILVIVLYGRKLYRIQSKQPTNLNEKKEYKSQLS